MNQLTTLPGTSAGPQAQTVRECQQRALMVKDLRQRLRELPDLRLNKVVAVRSEIELGTYDGEALIDALLRRLENDMGVLCRREAAE